jgi:N-acetylneuraminic acid mutarotase
MPQSRTNFTATTVNGKIYVIGGQPAGDATNVLEYDPVNNTWATKAAMTHVRSGHAATAINGKIYVVGGHDYVTTVDQVNTNEEYDVANNTWSTKEPMPTSRGDLAAVSINGKMYAVGGYATSNIWCGLNESYDPVTNSWVSLADMTPRSLFGAETVDGKIFAIGGNNAALGYQQDLNEMYNTQDSHPFQTYYIHVKD